MNLIKSRTDKNLIELLALGLFAIVMSFSDICFPYRKAINFSDGSIYQYIGHLMLKGKMPYTDAFDHKGILLYLLNALGCMINDRWGIWVINLIFLYLILYFSYITYRLFLPGLPSVIMCIVMYSDLATSHWVWNTPDFFAVLFEMIPFYLIVRSMMNRIRVSRKELVIIGLSIAGGFWLKQTVVIPTLLIMAMLCMNEIKNKNVKMVVSYISIILISFLTLSCVIILYLNLMHALQAMINDYFLYNLLYAANDTKEKAYEVILTHLNNSSFLITMIMGAICIVIRILEGNTGNRIKPDKIAVYGYIILLTVFIWLAFFGRPYRQYYLMCYPVLVILSGDLLKNILLAQKNSDKDKDRIRYLILHYGEIALSLLAIIAVIFNSIEVYYQVKSDSITPLSRQILSDSINDICTADEKIAVANNLDTGLYLATGHESATTYPYIQIMLFNNGDFIKDYNRQLMKAQPRVIVCMTWANDEKFLYDETLKEYYLYDQIGEYVIYAHK